MESSMTTNDTTAYKITYTQESFVRIPNDVKDIDSYLNRFLEELGPDQVLLLNAYYQHIRFTTSDEFDHHSKNAPILCVEYDMKSQ